MAPDREPRTEDGMGDSAHEPGSSSDDPKPPAPRSARPAGWLGWRPPLWGAALAVLAPMAAVAAWHWLHHSDATPRRWASVTEASRPCFDALTTPAQSPGAACFHPETESIAGRGFDWSRPHVAVYSTAAPPHAPPTLRDLADQAQAEAIRFLGKDPLQKDGAWTSLRGALDGAEEKAGEHDPFRFERVLVANIVQGVDWAPGDRMVWTRVLVQPINFAFAGYSVAETDNQTVKVSSVERTDSRKFSADLGATIPGMEGPKAGFGPSSEHSVKTETDINAQYEKLGVDIMPGFLRVMRQSETGGDAVGNTKVSLTAVTDPKTIWRRYPKDAAQRRPDDDPIVLLVTGTHFDGDGEPAPDDKARPAVDILPEVRVPHCALRARVWMLYEQRHIDKGREAYEESKQDVTLIRDAEDKQDVDIV